MARTNKYEKDHVFARVTMVWATLSKRHEQKKRQEQKKARHEQKNKRQKTDTTRSKKTSARTDAHIFPQIEHKQTSRRRKYTSRQANAETTSRRAEEEKT